VRPPLRPKEPEQFRVQYVAPILASLEEVQGADLAK